MDEQSGHYSEGFSVIPKTTCPHISDAVSPPSSPEEGINIHKPCGALDCLNPQSEENMICLKCFKIYCGRYVCMHMKEHSEQNTGSSELEGECHLIVASLYDLSFWCYGCDSYIAHKDLKPWFKALHNAKFNEDPTFYPYMDGDETSCMGGFTIELQQDHVGP